MSEDTILDLQSHGVGLRERGWRRDRANQPDARPSACAAGRGKSICNPLWGKEVRLHHLLLDGAPLCGLQVAPAAGIALTFP